MGESLTSTSTSSSGVSYSQIYESWINHDQQVNGNSTIPVETILIKLRLCQVLTQADYEMVDHEMGREKKLLKLFFVILSSKRELGFDQLVAILLENKCDGLAKDLLNEKENFSRTDYPNVPTGNVIPSYTTGLRNHMSEEDGQMLQAKTHLSRLLKKNVDFIAKCWSDVIPIAQTEDAFVQVQVLQHFKSENGNPVSSYHEVFDKDEKTIHERILIQADPGCGKTTYVNKLSLDWANEDEYLRDKFDFVFLIALQTLTTDVLDEIKCFLPKQSQTVFSSYAESAESKILLILDGFDELVESSQWYSSVIDILSGQSKQFQFFHVIVTTRRSHVDKIPQQFRGRSLLIKGFDQQSMKQFLDKQGVPLPSVDQQSNLSHLLKGFDRQSMKQFLDKQGVPLPSVGQQSNLSHLLQTPLFCAIYCSLHFGGGDPTELEDSYDLIKALVENSVKNTAKKKLVLNYTNQLDEIGKFAFQMLDSASLYFLKRFCRSEVIKPSFDLSRVNLDLLIKRTIPTRGVDRFKEEFSHPHQLIAEYLAARYFARSLTEEQLKQADASALINEINFILDLPLVRFFLFELLFLYLEKKYEESVFDNFTNIPELRFFWNMKSNKDILTLDNVSDFDFAGWNSESVNHSRFIPTLSKCRNLSSLLVCDCGLSKNQVEQLARCIDNNGLADLKILFLGTMQNVGSSTPLFHVLHKCPQLQRLRWQGCSMTQESLNIFLSTFNSNTFQQLDEILLYENEEIKVDDNFFIALEKCPKISFVSLSECVESDLSEVGRKAKETLKQRGCQFKFY